MSDEPVEPSDDDVRAMAVQQAALGLGPLMFWVVIVILSQTPATLDQAATPDEVQLVTILSGAHVLTCLSCWPMAMLLFQRALSRPPTGREEDTPLARLRAATILRAALLEGPALFGGVVCLLAVQTGAARDLPLVWLNAASTFVTLFVVIVTFPTKERVTRALRALRA